MQNKKDMNSENRDECHVITTDFRIKVHLDFFENLEFVHLHSAPYEEPVSERPLGGILTVINGYTEWISNISPVISIGWDWELCYRNAICEYVKTGPAFSNIAFHSKDLVHPILNEEEQMQYLLDKKIAQIGWENKILQYITQ